MKNLYKTQLTLINFILITNHAISQNLIVVNSDKKITNIYQSVYYLNDKDSLLSIKDILKAENQSKFVQNTIDPFNTDMNVKSVWVKFSLQNKTGKELFLKLENIDIPEIQIYIPQAEKDSFKVKKMGIIYPYGNKEVSSRFFITQISDGKDSSVQTFYIRINQFIHHEIPLNIGFIQNLLTEDTTEDVFFGMLFGVMLIMFLYNFYVYLVIKEIGYLYYVMHIFASFSFVLMLSGYGLAFLWGKYPIVNTYFSIFASLSTLFVIVPLASTILQTKKYTPIWHKGFRVFFFLLLVVIITSFFNLDAGLGLSQLVFLSLSLYVFIVGIVSYYNGNKIARFYVLGNMMYLGGFVVIGLKFAKIVPVTWFTMHANYFGTALEILFFSFALADKIRFINRERLEAQNENIRLVEKQKETLEEKVQERTKELEIANAEILTQNEELQQQQEELTIINENLAIKNKLIESQKEEIDTKIEEVTKINKKLETNQDILQKAYKRIQENENKTKELNAELIAKNEEMQQQQEELLMTNETLETTLKELKYTSSRLNKSIEYAYSIQQVILPKRDKLNSFFASHFSLYMPKDIVSGDFYWFTILDESKAIFALADCTGHGVPGAFMSMIGNTLLHEITKSKGIISPAEILTDLNLGIKNILRQEEGQNSDGMDISVCLFEKQESISTCKITFSGAKSNLFYVKENQIHQLMGDRISIGGISERSKEFINQEVFLGADQIIYFTSDGYIDQHNKERKRFSTNKFKELLQQIYPLDINEQEVIIHKTLKEYQQNEEQRDDISVIGIKL